MPCTHVDYELYRAGVDEARLEGIRLGLEAAEQAVTRQADLHKCAQMLSSIERPPCGCISAHEHMQWQIDRLDTAIRLIRAINPTYVLKNKNP